MTGFCLKLTLGSMDPESDSLPDLVSLELDEEAVEVGDVEEDGLIKTTNGLANGGCGSPRKTKGGLSADEPNEDEVAGGNNRGPGGSCQPSPCHSWISNASSCTNLFGEDDDEEYEGDGGG